MFRTQRMKLITACLLSVLLLLPVFACSADENYPDTVSIVTIWDAPEANKDGMVLDFSAASEAVRLQRRGFERGMAAYGADFTINEYLLSEQGEFEDTVEALADLYSYSEVLMSVGASSDIMTMYSAMESSYFNITYLIPFSDGDLLAESQSGYTVRLTVTAQKYSDFIGSEILTISSKDLINESVFRGSSVPDYSITAGVFFNDNFNDHAMAVRITQQLMDNGINIQYHNAYPTEKLMNTLIQCRDDGSGNLADLDVVILIGKDHDPISELPDVLNLWKDRQIPPAVIVIGYDPEVVPPEIAGADNVYFLRQKLDRSNCPVDIVTTEEGLGYTAGYLTMQVLDVARKQEPEKPHGFFYKYLTSPSRKTDLMNDYWEKYRLAVRSAIVQSFENVPCYGTVRFNSVSDNVSRLELVRYDASGKAVAAEGSDIFERVISIIRSQYGISE